MSDAAASRGDRHHALPEAAGAALPALFISDLHLADDRPHTTSAFLAFLAGPAAAAGSLFILGDLFDYWTGDDDDTAFNGRICRALHALSESGVALYFIAGNRDLLAGDGFARAAGLQILADPTLIRLGDRPVLLSHGDAQCTDDLAYQAYRKQVRDPAWQAAFLAQTLAERRAFIERVRAHSEAAKQEKAMAIMDVNTSAIEAMLREHGYPTLIHGHTHRPARHEHLVDGKRCERWVLGDWHDHATWLEFDGSSFRTGAD